MLAYDDKDASSTERTHDYTTSTPTDSQSATLTEVSQESAFLSNTSGLEETLKYIVSTLGRRGSTPDLELKLPHLKPTSDPADKDSPLPQDELQPPDPGPPPDGGVQAWLQVLGSWVIAVDTWG